MTTKEKSPAKNAVCKMYVASVLGDLGYKVPSDIEMDKLLDKAVEKVKKHQKLDERFDLGLVSIYRKND